jgi:pre-mRNA-processing factor 40
MVQPPVLASVAGTAAAALPLAPGAFQPAMGMSPFVGGMPPFVRPPVAPVMPKPPAAPAPPAQLNDPNNDASCWSEHLTDDGKKYWFNMKTQVSTFDKPLVLKTPEERAIPPCAWKEYTAPDGKNYYSNGKDTT